MLNINVGHNEELLRKCPALNGYIILVRCIHEYQSEGLELFTAIDQGIDRCIRESVLKEYLLKKKSEVKLMLLTEFDEELFARTMKEEGWSEGEARMGRLNLLLLTENRLEALERAIKDKAFRESLYKRYGL